MPADCRRIAAAAALLLAAVSAHAQFAQYTPPGSLAEEQIPTQERVKAALDEAQYHLGPLSLAPWLALKNVAYVNNVFAATTGQQSDITATLGGGVQAYLPLGHRLTLGMYALPEYVWWRDLSGMRGWNGAYGAGLFGYFNRMTVEIQAGGSRAQQYASAEVQVPITLQDRRASALVEVQVLGHMSLFARGGVDRWRYLQGGLPPDIYDPLAQLDRDEKHIGGGIRLHFTKEFSLGLGAERYTTDFISAAGGPSNSGTAPIAELAFKTTRVSVNINAAALDLKASASSGFVTYSGTNGNFRFAYRPASRLELQLYGGRNLAYSVAPGTPYYLDERTGVAMQSTVGWRVIGKIFAETGHDEYVAAVPAAGPGSEKLKDFGALVSVQLAKKVVLTVGGDRTRYTSAGGANDRSVARVQTSIQFATGKGQWW
jgi:hypothetical protein